MAIDLNKTNKDENSYAQQNQNPYGQNPYAQQNQNPYEQNPYAQQNQNPYGQNPYVQQNQNPYGQNPYAQQNQNPYGQNPYIQPTQPNIMYLTEPVTSKRVIKGILFVIAQLLVSIFIATIIRCLIDRDFSTAIVGAFITFCTALPINRFPQFYRTSSLKSLWTGIEIFVGIVLVIFVIAQFSA